jgi:hypothetical protein
MGTSVMLDIVGSLSTFGLLLLAVLRLNAAAGESSYAYNQNYILQRNMVVLTVMLENDLKHVGTEVFDQDGGIQLADTTDLVFRGVLQGDTTISTVEWKLGSLVGTTPNPNIRYLSRIKNGVESKINLGVTKFNFAYWSIIDANTKLPTPIVAGAANGGGGNIGPISVYIRLESPYKMKQQFMNDTSQYDMVWRQIRSVSRNNSIQYPTGN